MSAFLHMGGYAVFVWSAYGLAALTLIGLTVATVVSLKRASAELADLEALAPARRRRRRPAAPAAEEE